MKSSILAITAVFLLLGCKKDETENPLPVSELDKVLNVVWGNSFDNGTTTATIGETVSVTTPGQEHQFSVTSKQENPTTATDAVKGNRVAFIGVGYELNATITDTPAGWLFIELKKDGLAVVSDSFKL